MKLTAGQRAEISVTVSEADTAAAPGSGDVPVLGTVERVVVERVVVDRARFLARRPETQPEER